jgi:putative redox protein
MIKTQSGDAPYLVRFTNGTQEALADVLPMKGGQGAGFGPHELMEASLATCINMWIRMQADKENIPVGAISVSVNLKRDDPNERIFEYSINIDGTLPEQQRAMLLQLADDCPVRKTLCKRISFERQKT